MADRTQAQGDEVYQPQDGDQRAEEQPDLENALDEPGVDQSLDEGYSPPERPLGVTRHGTTAAERREGESLDERLAQETPEVGEIAAKSMPVDEGVGRLAPVAGNRPDHAIDVLAVDVGEDGGGQSAEEAAMHVVGRNVAPARPPEETP
ncbi:DUF5709 domain-containing protein [Streptomyces sp. G-G2]|uniref:DUF5709 domain-containing protein n=1 Tax=Streptomyces sp. G-G2 TaxID=3046201 RepID=UPI0024BB3091|nr:DUF5709 domain-containing protein [Streptomyces sp. G-G2]MDJ0386205.1 DUF5709 domain-containing protein [Streptomyces sp. G-G2]